VTSVGGYISKLAFGVYSTRPAEGGLRHADLTGEAEALPRRELASGHAGAVTVESYALLYEKEETPDRAVVAALLDDGRRTWARIQEPSLLDAMTREELIGRTGVVERGRLIPS
jgi:acetyl-CoA C-acetyltransferase